MIPFWFYAFTAASAAPPDIEGTWALRYQVVTQNQVPVVGSLQSTSETLVLARIQSTDHGWFQSHQVCGAGVQGGLVRSRVPESYIRSVPEKRYGVTLQQTESGPLYFADTGVFVSGYDTRCGDVVPRDASDPCVIDWDSDGKPGATILAKAPLFPWVEVYVSQRNHVTLEGQVLDGRSIRGRVRMAHMETHVIGASNRLFHKSPTATLVAEQSFFTMQRLDDSATCDQVLEASKSDS